MLITSRDDIKRFVPVSEGLSFEIVTPYIESVETDTIIPLIGQELYDRLQEFDTNGAGSGSTDDSAAMAKALFFTQKAIANLAIYEGFTLMTVNLSDKGARRYENEEQKSLFKYQEDEAKFRLRNTGNNTIDTLLAYLEDNIEYFPEFESTSTYSTLKTSIVKDTETFNGIYNIGNSRLVFLKLAQHIREAIDMDIVPVIGQELYDLIIEELPKETPSESVTDLLPYIQKPLVYMAISKGLTTLGIDINSNGLITLKSATFATSMREEQVSTQAEIMAKSAMDMGIRYLEKLKQYLITNAETYTTYSGQSGYPYKRDNTDKKTIWI